MKPAEKNWQRKGRNGNGFNQTKDGDKKTEQKKRKKKKKKKIMEMKLENVRKSIAMKQAERNNFVERQRQLFEKQKNEMNKEIHNLNRMLSIKQQNYKHMENSLKQSD